MSGALTAALQSYVATVDRSAAPAAVVPLLGPQADPAGTPPAREAASKALTALLTGMQDKEAARALLDALGNTVVHDAADAALRQYLAGLGPERAGPAIAAVYFLDDWLAVALGVTPDQLAAETRRRGLQLEPPGDIAAAASVARDGTAVVSAHPYQPTDGHRTTPPWFYPRMGRRSDKPKRGGRRPHCGTSSSS
jgi:hypothetical protein